MERKKEKEYDGERETERERERERDGVRTYVNVNNVGRWIEFVCFKANLCLRHRCEITIILEICSVCRKVREGLRERGRKR